MGTPEPPRSGFAFYLSYAHLPPDDYAAGHDAAVTDFFDDLCRAVADLAGTSGPSPGRYDRGVPVGEDTRGAVARMLGEAEVFVPLISPRYLSGGWTMDEYRAFRERVQRSGAEPSHHIVPVLWIPLSPGERALDGLDIREFEVAVDYPSNGLRALRELSIYRPQYAAVVDRLARRIADIVENSPIGPSPVGPLRRLDADTATAQFAVAVMAPTLTTVSPQRWRVDYGSTPTDWKPFADSGSAIAAQAAYVAERLALPTAVLEPEVLARRFPNTPGVLLIDPWILSVHDGRSRLEQILRAVADWVIPLVVCDDRDPQYADRGRALFLEAIEMLRSTGHDRAQTHPRSLDGFAAAMPVLVMQARRRSLRGRPRTDVRRPRLADALAAPSSPSMPGADER